MKVLILCEIFDPTIESQENVLAKYYVRHGCSVTVLTSTQDSVFDYIADENDSAQEERIDHFCGAKIIRVRYLYNILNRIRALSNVPRILREERPDLIFMMDIMPIVRPVVKYKLANPGVRFVMDYHADFSNSAKNLASLLILHGVVRKWFLDQARPHLDAIFPVTPGSARFLNEVYKVPFSEMDLLPLGADMDIGRRVKASRRGRALRTKMGIPDDYSVIFSGGKFDPAKRTELLIQAIRRMPGLRVHLVIVGTANKGYEAYENELRALAGDDHRISFAGWLGRAEIYEHLDMADLAVFPASQSILWVQAVSMGLPMIVGNTGEQDPGYMNLYGNIVVLGPQEINADRIALELEGLLGDPVRMNDMRQGANRVYDEVLNWDKLIWKTVRADTDVRMESSI